MDLARDVEALCHVEGDEDTTEEIVEKPCPEWAGDEAFLALLEEFEKNPQKIFDQDMKTFREYTDLLKTALVPHY